MRLGRRAPEEAPTAPEHEPIVRATGTYRVAVAHRSEGHPEQAPAHWGPAYDASLAETIGHLTDRSSASVDLLEEAKKGAGRCQAEHGSDYDVWVERLVTRDGDGEWERVG